MTTFFIGYGQVYQNTQFLIGMLCAEIRSCNLEVGFANIKLGELSMIKGLKEGWEYTKAKYKIKA